jgi:membrane-associated protein
MQAIVIARFIPVIRTFAPIVAGIVGMDYKHFFVYNIAGALLWAAGTIAAAYYLGLHVPWVSEYFTPIVITIIIVSSLPIVWEFLKVKFFSPK